MRTSPANGPTMTSELTSADQRTARELIAHASRLVVKVGSSSLTSAGHLDPARLDLLVDAVAARRRAGKQMLIVSSGAIAAGIGPLGLKKRPKDLATQQAAASVGQLLLAERYAASFARHGLTTGQVLLTVDDLHRRSHYTNAVRTLERLMALGVVPVVNENDTVATHEIRFGDNDRLAALVAHLVQADALVLLSDVDGLYTGHPSKPGSELVSDIRSIEQLDRIEIGGAGSGVGTGGMSTKIDAALIATQAGIPVLLSDAPSIENALVGRGGTAFDVLGKRTSARLFWLRHATTPRGRLVLDDGAVHAVVAKRVSLLPAGITAVAGDFSAGDPVEIAAADGTIVARGLSGFDSDDLASVLGQRTADLPAELRREAVHRDDLILL